MPLIHADTYLNDVLLKYCEAALADRRGDTSQLRMVKGGSSYLSQSELPLTFGLGKRDKVDRLVIDWPNGGTEEYKNLATGRAYECVEAKGITPLGSY